eukprot:jgi/Ulvmu1/5295/UM022_0089.1
MSYYTVLGVPEDASLEAIKAAYRRKLLRVHPDKMQLAATVSTDTAASELKMIQEAFSVLKDSQSRCIYDAQLRSAQQRVRFEGIPWMTIQVSEMDLVEDARGQPLYEYECRCGGVFELGMDSAHDLVQGDIQLSCLHCTSALKVTS